MIETELVFGIKHYKTFYNLKRRVLRTIKMNKLHRKERIIKIVKRKMKKLK